MSCMARYKATAIDRGASMGNPAAMLGTALHATLERFVEPGMIAAGVWDWELLMALWTVSFRDVFGHDNQDEWFLDGKQVLSNWYNRTSQQSDLMEVEIVSREVKKNFEVPYVLNGATQKLPLNYIIDRLDKLGDKVYRVVDYKSQRVPLSPDEMRKKIQVRIYALAIQIENPDAEEIWVQYDFLRYERVGVRFTRDDNVRTWAELKRMLQRIVDTPDEYPPETLNADCRYCPRKFTCATFKSNVTMGGVFAVDVDQLAQLYYELKAQEDGIKMAKEEIEQQLLKHAADAEVLEWESANGSLNVKVTSKRSRYINHERLAKLLGPELAKDYGRITVKDLTTLRADHRLDASQKSMLDSVVEFKHSEPGIKVIKSW